VINKSFDEAGQELKPSVPLSVSLQINTTYCKPPSNSEDQYTTQCQTSSLNRSLKEALKFSLLL